ncbi:hypothetical protein BHE74_00035104, partial [Ensete ventricosum]
SSLIHSLLTSLYIHHVINVTSHSLNTSSRVSDVGPKWVRPFTLPATARVRDEACGGRVAEGIVQSREGSGGGGVIWQMLTWPPRPRALGQLARRRGRPDAGSQSGTGARLTARTAGMVERYDDMVSNKGSKDIRSLRPTRAEAPPPDPNSTTPAIDLRGRTRVIRPSGRAPTSSRDDCERASAQGPEPVVLTQRTQRQAESTGQAPNLTLTFLALKGGPMSQERPFGNSGWEHHPEPNHPQPTEEVTIVVPTPYRFWRMIIDPEFPSPVSNPASFVVTIEAFLGLTSQVQPLAGMVQTIVPYLPQLMHSTAHQSAPPATPPQTEAQ